MGIIKKYNQYINESIDPPEDNNQEFDTSSLVNDLESDYDGDEEEGHQYIGSKMLAELADKLGTKVVNNSVEYNGKVINFFSETEKYHVDKKKFSTSDEVVEYLNGDSNGEILENKKSYRKTLPNNLYSRRSRR